MCGIAGFFGELDKDRAGHVVQLMLDGQVHRGPDDGGVCSFRSGESSVALGNRRLAIQDLSPLGHQPMVNTDTGDVLVYNGEIYNAPELRRALELEGLTFRGRSDTEVLLRAYEHWGKDCLKRLRGMFAFALWDGRRRALFIARDHLGIKPLYYASIPGVGLFFASELTAMLASGLLPFEIDRAALAGYLAYGAVQEPLTIIKGAAVVPPASWMEADGAGQIRTAGRYWQIPPPDASIRPADTERLIEEGRALLKQSVQRHLLSDVPLGVFLSSGLDSTAVLGLASRVAAEQVQAFTVTFPDNHEYDEGATAREVAARQGVAYHECPVDGATATEWAREGLNHMDQPALDGLNTYIVSRAVRERGIVVALSGQGGDELFGGYHSFREIPRWQGWMSYLKALGPEWRARLARLASRRMGSVLQKKAQELARTGLDLPTLYSHYRRLSAGEDLARLGLNASDLGLAETFQTTALDYGSLVVEKDAVASVSRMETAFYLGNTLLRDGDVFGMANSLEIRVPLLDRDLVEWAFRIPGDVLLPSRSPQKYLLRRMCAEFYTAGQTEQRKRGFTLPFSSWLTGPLGEMMEDCVASVKGSGLVDPAGVDRIKAVFLREPRTAAWRGLWCVVALGYWLSRHRGMVAASAATA